MLLLILKSKELIFICKIIVSQILFIQKKNITIIFTMQFKAVVVFIFSLSVCFWLPMISCLQARWRFPTEYEWQKSDCYHLDLST